MTTQDTKFRTKVLTSAKLAGLKFASEIGLRLVSTVVLTRLLAPEIYGVFAVVMVFLYLLEMCSDIGLRSLILTKEGETDDVFLRTCWTVSVLRGAIIALFACLLALALHQLQTTDLFTEDNPYNADILPWAFAAIGGTSLVMGFQSPMPFVYERDMRFERMTVLEILVNICTLIITVALAFYLRSVWALVLGGLAKSLMHVTLSFALFSGPKMQFSFNKAHFSLLIGRGKWIAGHSILTALSKSADRLVLGLILSSSTFGFYYIARQLVDLAIGFLQKINAQMGLQIFTHLQGSTHEGFKLNYYRYRLFIDAFAGLSAGTGILLAPLLIDLIFDDRYRDVAPMVQLLVPGILLTGPLILRDAFSAERRFKRMTWLSVVSTATLWAGLLVSVLVVESITAALLFIAFYRLPEAMLLTISGYKRGWFVFWRELAIVFFFAAGLLLGQLILLTWNLFT